MIAVNKPRFKPGKIIGTPACLEAIEQADQTAWTFIARHLVGDWGIVDVDDAQANNEALIDGSRLLSAYLLNDELNTKIWVITEAANDNGHREATTLLLPEEY